MSLEGSSENHFLKPLLKLFNQLHKMLLAIELYISTMNELSMEELSGWYAHFPSNIHPFNQPWSMVHFRNQKFSDKEGTALLLGTGLCDKLN